jgi:hypothetical protein
MTATPALDFCRKVQAWQESDANKTAGLVVIMPDREQSELGAILTEAGTVGNLNWSENRARRWLVGYREMENDQRVLTPAQRAELNDIVRQVTAEDRLTGTRTASWKPLQRPLIPRKVPLILAAILAVLAAVLGIRAATGSGSSQVSPPAAGAPANPAGVPQVAPVLTPLQQFRQDWNVPAGAQASAGNPAALVLLDNGLYYPASWAIPAGDAAWAPDITGTLTGLPIVHGGQADVTDSDGTTWTIAVGQPFVLSSDPGTVLRVLRDATVQSMPASHAIVIRRHI